jgi:hypothetical protein
VAAEEGASAASALSKRGKKKAKAKKAAAEERAAEEAAAAEAKAKAKAAAKVKAEAAARAAATANPAATPAEHAAGAEKKPKGKKGKKPKAVKLTAPPQKKAKPAWVALAHENQYSLAFGGLLVAFIAFILLWLSGGQETAQATTRATQTAS